MEETLLKYTMMMNMEIFFHLTHSESRFITSRVCPKHIPEKHPSNNEKSLKWRIFFLKQEWVFSLNCFLCPCATLTSALASQLKQLRTSWASCRKVSKRDEFLDTLVLDCRWTDGDWVPLVAKNEIQNIVFSSNHSYQLSWEWVQIRSHPTQGWFQRITSTKMMKVCDRSS